MNLKRKKKQLVLQRICWWFITSRAKPKCVLCFLTAFLILKRKIRIPKSTATANKRGHSIYTTVSLYSPDIKKVSSGHKCNYTSKLNHHIWPLYPGRIGKKKMGINLVRGEQRRECQANRKLLCPFQMSFCVFSSSFLGGRYHEYLVSEFLMEGAAKVEKILCKKIQECYYPETVVSLSRKMSDSHQRGAWGIGDFGYPWAC